MKNNHAKPLNVLMLSGGHKYLKTNGINVGDIAQLEHALLLFTTEFPGANVTLLAHSLNDGCPKSGLRYSRNLVTALIGKTSARLPNIIKVAYRAIMLIIWAKLPNLSRLFFGDKTIHAAAIREFQMADALVLSGSGTLSDHYVKGPAFIWSVAILCAKTVGLPVIMLGQQIGPLRGRLSRGLIKLALKNVDFVGVRDEQSAEVATDLGVTRAKIRFTGDEGFYLPPADKNAVSIKLQKINITEPFIAAQFRIDANCPLEGYVDWFADALSSLSARIGGIVVFVPFSYASAGDDREACQLVAEKLSVRYVIFDNGGCSAETKGVLANAEIAIGVANHFCVFAASVGVPTIGLYAGDYMAQKLRGIEMAHGHVRAQSIAEVGTPDQFTNNVMETFSFVGKTEETDSAWKKKPACFFDWLHLLLK
jgi:polysaccharide pyruvyl transferase WcaK-like protein